MSTIDWMTLSTIDHMTTTSERLVTSPERADGWVLIDLLASVGVTDWRKVVEVAFGPDTMLVRLQEETLCFMVDFPK